MRKTGKSIELRIVGVLSFGMGIVYYFVFTPRIYITALSRGLSPSIFAGFQISVCLVFLIAGLSAFFLDKTSFYLYISAFVLSLAYFVFNITQFNIRHFYLPQYFIFPFVQKLLYHGPLILMSVFGGVFSKPGKKIKLRLSQNAKKKIFILAISFVFYCVVYWIGYIHEINALRIFHMSWWSIIAAFLGAALYLALRITTLKVRKNAVLAALQAFVIFSAMPYVLNLEIPSYSVGFRVNTFGIFLVFVIAILPEIFGFVGLVFLRRRLILPSVSLLALAVVALIEIFPMRASLRFDTFDDVMPRLHGPIQKPFCTNDREFELRRMLTTTEKLIQVSKNSPAERLQTIKIYWPDLDIRPALLKLDTTYMYRDYWADPYIEQTVVIDTALDSDGDRLTDFREIQVLSDAYSVDTDSDGIIDGEDSDPLNPYVDSDIAHLNADIIAFYLHDNKDPQEYYGEQINWLCIVDNNFHGGRGEVANFGKHIIIMSGYHLSVWYRIFDYSYRYNDVADINIGRPLFDITKRIAVADIASVAGGGQWLMVKWQGKWRVIAARFMWIS